MNFDVFLVWNIIIAILILIGHRSSQEVEGNLLHFGVAVAFFIAALLNVFAITTSVLTENVTINYVRVVNTTATLDASNDTVTTYVYERVAGVPLQSIELVYVYAAVIIMITIYAAALFNETYKYNKDNTGG